MTELTEDLKETWFKTEKGKKKMCPISRETNF